jgi:hypothetical protein
MVSEDADELVLFSDVRVMASTGAALLCRISGKDVWLPRWHVSGKLWHVGDRGKRFVRRWVASDRHLAVPHRPSLASPSISPARLPARLRVVQKEPRGIAAPYRNRADQPA